MYLVYNNHFYNIINEIPAPKHRFLLVQFDYIGFYLPEIWFYKFEWIETLLKTNLMKDSLTQELGIVKIDLTHDFRRLVDVTNLVFDRFGQLIYHVCINDIHPKDIPLYQPFLAFFDYLGLKKSLMDKLRPSENIQH